MLNNQQLRTANYELLASAPGNRLLATVLGPLLPSRTLYKSAHLCKTNPISEKAKMNVSNYIKREYEEMDTWSSGKTNPIKPNTNPIQTQFAYGPKRTQPSFNQRVMKMKPPSLSGKTNPNKPNQSQFQTDAIPLSVIRPIFGLDIMGQAAPGVTAGQAQITIDHVDEQGKMLFCSELICEIQALLEGIRHVYQ